MEWGSLTSETARSRGILAGCVLGKRRGEVVLNVFDYLTRRKPEKRVTIMPPEDELI